ncbi:MAG: ABC transporter ATP-binding protein [Acidobacteriota bacterium]
MDLPMQSEKAVSVRNIKKTYPIFNQPRDLLLREIYGRLGRLPMMPNSISERFRERSNKCAREFLALEGISFDVARGESVGIIGMNGSGKSTLLQIIAGTLVPNEGAVSVRGRVAALLELGTGFNPEFTGRENVYLSGAILGLKRAELAERFAEIASFADIGDFMDQPVKVYSSGMAIRLAFSVYTCLDPDVLIIDEALSVGDIFFQQKCHARMENLLQRGTAIIMASHDLRAIEKYSSHVLLLHRGQCVFQGYPSDAVQRYYRLNTSRRSALQNAKANRSSARNSSGDTGPLTDWPSEDAFLDFSQADMIGETAAARFLGVAVCDSNGNPQASFEIGETACFYYEFEVLSEIQVPVGGLTLTNILNLNIHGKSSLQHLAQAPSAVSRGSRVRFKQSVELSVAHGEYTFSVGLGTISDDDYARVTELSFEELVTKLRPILRIGRAGKLIVKERSKGINLPFHGYADLRGDCRVSVVSTRSEAKCT